MYKYDCLSSERASHTCERSHFRRNAIANVRKYANLHLVSCGSSAHVSRADNQWNILPALGYSIDLGVAPHWNVLQ